MALKAKNERAVAVALAAEAAGEQGAFWEFCDSLYDDQGRLDDPHLWQRARAWRAAPCGETRRARRRGSGARGRARSAGT
jgi:protein-disulfide isomerase